MEISSRRRTSVDRRSGRGSLGADFESLIHLLHHELYVASIPKQSLSRVSHSLLQVLLGLFDRDPKGRQNHFFSFTETTTDFSFILDEELLQAINPSGSLEVEETKWRPLVIEVGAMGCLTGVSKIVASVIAPLADRGISVFCLSTNQDDYVMVKESDLERALACLAKRFRLVCDSDRPSDVSRVQAVERKREQLDSPIRSKTIFPVCHPRPIVHSFVCSNNKFSICSVVPGALPSIGTLLLELMLFNQRSSSEDVFFSLSIIDEDISMVVDSRDIDRFPDDSFYLNEDCWRLIRIGEGPLGFEECGIVAQVCAPLAQAGISTYYICTFCNDHTLVPEESVEKALQLFNERYESKCMQNGHKCAKISESVLDSHAAIVNGTNT